MRTPARVLAPTSIACAGIRTRMPLHNTEIQYRANIIHVSTPTSSTKKGMQFNEKFGSPDSLADRISPHFTTPNKLFL